MERGRWETFELDGAEVADEASGAFTGDCAGHLHAEEEFERGLNADAAGEVDVEFVQGKCDFLASATGLAGVLLHVGEARHCVVFVEEAEVSGAEGVRAAGLAGAGGSGAEPSFGYRFGTG